MRNKSNKSREVEGLQNAVIAWFTDHRREFPWRSTNNPFFILVAEVLLRQTQAERIEGPYMELISKFPTPSAMAQANVEQLREWFHPLGLVKRADRLVEISTILIRDFVGEVPRDLEQLKKLPGLGEYSARAILCLAYDFQVPMIDEGSGRVLRRIFNLRSKGPAYSDQKLLAKAKKLLPPGLTRSFNLGLIDIAAAYCHYRNPESSLCPLLGFCYYGQSITEKAARSKEDQHEKF